MQKRTSKKSAVKGKSRSPYRSDQRAGTRGKRERDPEEKSAKKRMPKRLLKKKRTKAKAALLPKDAALLDLPALVRRSGPALTELNAAQRKNLKGLAHHLNPVVQIGKHLVTDSVAAEVGRALDHHELIKVKFIEGKDNREALAETLAEKTNCFLVAMIGNVAILFREQPNEKKRKIWA